MASLPFLVVHGGLVWKGLLVGIVGVVVGLGYAWRRSRATRHARTSGAKRVAGTTAPKPGHGSVRGKLGGGAIVGRELPYDERSLVASGDHWIDCDGTRIDLVGPMKVVSGTAAVSRRPRAIAWTIADGDEVVVEGVLAQAAGDEPTGYREGASKWTLTGDPIEIAAVKPRARPFPLSVTSFASLVGLVALATYGTMHKIGKHAAHEARWQWFDIAGPIEISRDVSIATSMPGSRDDGLEALDAMFDRGFEHTDAAEALHLELDDERDVPCSKATHRSRFDLALEDARACPVKNVTSEILARLGRYSEAHALHAAATPKDAVTNAIAASMWSDAAALVPAFLEDDAKRSAMYPDATQRNAVRDRANCLASLFRFFGGDKNAFAAMPETTFCRALRVLALPEAEQRPALAMLGPEASDYTAQWLVRELTVLLGGEPSYPEYGDVSDLAFGFSDRTWLTPFVKTDTVADHYRRAAIAVERGDFAAAKAEAAILRGMPDGTHSLYSLEIAIALRTGEPLAERPDEYLHPGLEDAVEARRNGQVRDLLYAIGDPCKVQQTEAAAGIRNGDGGPLARLVRSCRLYWDSSSKYLLAVAPLVKTHRDELAEAMRHYRDEYGFARDPLRVDSIAISRDIARMLGDAPEALRLQAIIDTHFAVLGDRDRVLALILWLD